MEDKYVSKNYGKARDTQPELDATEHVYKANREQVINDMQLQFDIDSMLEEAEQITKNAPDG